MLKYIEEQVISEVMVSSFLKKVQVQGAEEGKEREGTPRDLMVMGIDGDPD